MPSLKTYFVTGATGVVGSALIPLLAAEPDTEIRLLIRAASPEALRDRMDALYEFWGSDLESKSARERITPLRGDMVSPRFGLNEADYEALVRESTHIIHAAGDVRMNLSLADARRSALESVRNMVELALRMQETGALQKVEYVSTVGVGGRMPMVPEDWITVSREFHNSYEQAKAEAEDYLHEQIERRRLPVTVHRPSMVVGHSQSGKIIQAQVFYYLCLFLSGQQTGGVVPVIRHTRLDTIPVDYVARALAWSSRNASSAGRVFNLCSGPAMSIPLIRLTDALQDIYRRIGHDLPRQQRVPMWLFKALLPMLKALGVGGSRQALSNLAIFLDYAADRQSFCNDLTSATLAAEGIEASEPESYLTPVIRYYLGAS